MVQYVDLIRQYDPLLHARFRRTLLGTNFYSLKDIKSNFKHSCSLSQDSLSTQFQAVSPSNLSEGANFIPSYLWVSTRENGDLLNDELAALKTCREESVLILGNDDQLEAVQNYYLLTERLEFYLSRCEEHISQLKSTIIQVGKYHSMICEALSEQSNSIRSLLRLESRLLEKCLEIESDRSLCFESKRKFFDLKSSTINSNQRLRQLEEFKEAYQVKLHLTDLVDSKKLYFDALHAFSLFKPLLEKYWNDLGGFPVNELVSLNRKSLLHHLSLKLALADLHSVNKIKDDLEVTLESYRELDATIFNKDFWREFTRIVKLSLQASAKDCTRKNSTDNNIDFSQGLALISEAKPLEERKRIILEIVAFQNSLLTLSFWTEDYVVSGIPLRHAGINSSESVEASSLFQRDFSDWRRERVEFSLGIVSVFIENWFVGITEYKDWLSAVLTSMKLYNALSVPISEEISLEAIYSKAFSRLFELHFRRDSAKIQDIIRSDPLVMSPIPSSLKDLIQSWSDLMQQEENEVSCGTNVTISNFRENDMSILFEIEESNGAKKCRFWILSSTLTCLQYLDTYFSIHRYFTLQFARLQGLVEEKSYMLLKFIVDAYLWAVVDGGLVKQGILQFLTLKKLCLCYKTMEFYQFLFELVFKNPVVKGIFDKVMDMADKLRLNLVDQMYLLYNDRIRSYFLLFEKSSSHPSESMGKLLLELETLRKILHFYFFDNQKQLFESMTQKVRHLFYGFISRYLDTYADRKELVLKELQAFGFDDLLQPISSSHH